VAAEPLKADWRTLALLVVNLILMMVAWLMQVAVEAVLQQVVQVAAEVPCMPALLDLQMEQPEQTEQ